MYQIKTNGCIRRSRANFIEFGERNSKYFIILRKGIKNVRLSKNLCWVMVLFKLVLIKFLMKKNCTIKTCILHVNLINLNQNDLLINCGAQSWTVQRKRSCECMIMVVSGGGGHSHMEVTGM